MDLWSLAQTPLLGMCWNSFKNVVPHGWSLAYFCDLIHFCDSTGKNPSRPKYLVPLAVRDWFGQHPDQISAVDAAAVVAFDWRGFVYPRRRLMVGTNLRLSLVQRSFLYIGSKKVNALFESSQVFRMSSWSEAFAKVHVKKPVGQVWRWRCRCKADQLLYYIQG